MSSSENKKKRSLESNSECIEPPQKKSRKVEFNPIVTVITIPNILKYNKANLNDSIWWNKRDYMIFKDQTAKEVGRFMVRTATWNSKVAFKELYECGKIQDEPIIFEF